MAEAKGRDRTKATDPLGDVERQVEEREQEAARRAAEAAEGPDLSLSAADAKKYEKAKIIVVTGAMNAAPLHENFWAALNRYCEARGAELLIIPLKYRNPTAPLETKAKKDWWWAPEVQQYLAGSRVQLHPSLFYMGDVPVAATALDPLTGLESMTRGASGIFGHAQIAMDTIPTPQNDLPKILHTTGACTEKNYSRSKAGRRAEFHHSIGAVVVEKVGKKFHLRQLVADSEGGFYDVKPEYRYWHAKGSRKAGRCPMLVCGDIHVDVSDPEAVAATFTAKDSMCAVLDPEEIAIHDVLDFSSGEGHHDDPIERIVKALSGNGGVRGELERTVEFMNTIIPARSKKKVVASNHHDHLAWWAKKADWRTVSPQNAEILLELQLACLRGARLEAAGVEQIDPFEWWCKENGLDPSVEFIPYGESHRVAGIETGFHGHVGPSGARGSRRGLDRTGTRMVIGHSHSPGIYRGLTQVGLLALMNLLYARRGPSGWLQSNCAIHANGKRQLLNIVEGSW